MKLNLRAILGISLIAVLTFGSGQTTMPSDDQTREIKSSTYAQKLANGSRFIVRRTPLSQKQTDAVKELLPPEIPDVFQYPDYRADELTLELELPDEKPFLIAHSFMQTTKHSEPDEFCVLKIASAPGEIVVAIAVTQVIGVWRIPLAQGLDWKLQSHGSGRLVQDQWDWISPSRDQMPRTGITADNMKVDLTRGDDRRWTVMITDVRWHPTSPGIFEQADSDRWKFTMKHEMGDKWPTKP